MTEEVQTLVERERDAAIATANANAIKILELIAQAKAMNSQIEELREAAARGLEWVIEAANERKAKDAVFDNAMKDIRFIEQALSHSSEQPND